MSLTKLSLGGNNDVIYKIFSATESLVSNILVLAGDGNIEKLFYGVCHSQLYPPPPPPVRDYELSPGASAGADDTIIHNDTGRVMLNSSRKTSQKGHHCKRTIPSRGKKWLTLD
jgi:hypothetical protein